MKTRKLGLLACAAFAASAGCERKAATAPLRPAPSGEVWMTAQQVRDARVQIEPVRERLVNTELATSGKVTFDDLRVSHVFSPVTGRVIRISADPGQRVEKGDALAIIQSPDVGNALADLAKAESDLAAARHNFTRQQDLYAVRAVSQKDFEAAQDDYRKAKAETERARRKAALLRGTATDDVTQSFTLRAPIAGEVITRSVNPGEEIQGQYGGGTALELFTVGELDSVWVVGDVFEMDIGRVHKGAPVSIKVVAYPGKTFTGQVDYIAGALDPATRTARVRCSIPNPTRELKPEMYATVSIGVEGTRVTALPRAALLRVSDQTVAFVRVGTSTDGRERFVRRVVAVDETVSGPYVPVARGVAVGEQVVSAGGILLLGML
jgi:cobalt-zinc-cadmium efflux system membrane fusion protein